MPDSDMVYTLKDARRDARNRRLPLDVRLRAKATAAIARRFILESLPGYTETVKALRLDKGVNIKGRRALLRTFHKQVAVFQGKGRA